MDQKYFYQQEISKKMNLDSNWDLKMEIIDRGKRSVLHNLLEHFIKTLHFEISESNLDNRFSKKIEVTLNPLFVLRGIESDYTKFLEKIIYDIEKDPKNINLYANTISDIKWKIDRAKEE